MYTLAYTLLKQRLAAISGIKKVEWYTGQEQGKGDLKNTPAILIEFLPSEMERIGSIQRSQAEFKLHLVTSTMLISGKQVKNETDKDHMYLLDAVFNATQSKKGMLSDITAHATKKGTGDDLMLYNAANRNQIVPPHQQKRLMVSIQKFKALFYDHSGVKNYTSFVAALEVNEA